MGPGLGDRMSKGKWHEDAWPAGGEEHGQLDGGHHLQVGGVWPGSGSDHEELAYNVKEFELCSADSGSCRHVTEGIDFCVLEISLRRQGGEGWMGARKQ